MSSWPVSCLLDSRAILHSRHQSESLRFESDDQSPERNPMGSSRTPKNFYGKPRSFWLTTPCELTLRLPRSRSRGGAYRHEDPGIFKPQFLTDPSHLVNIDIAGDVAGARQVAGIVHAGRLDPRGDLRSVPQESDLVERFDRQPPSIHRQSHRPVEGADQCGWPATCGAGDQQFVGLVNIHQSRSADFAQQRRKVVRLGVVELNSRSDDLGNVRGTVRTWSLSWDSVSD